MNTELTEKHGGHGEKHSGLEFVSAVTRVVTHLFSSVPSLFLRALRVPVLKMVVR